MGTVLDDQASLARLEAQVLTYHLHEIEQMNGARYGFNSKTEGC